MLYYKNGRFRMDSISYELPDGVYIDTELQSVIATGFEIVDPEGKFRIHIKGEHWEENSYEFFEKVIFPFGYDRLGEIEPVENNGMQGYKLWYQDSKTNTLEYRFDLPEEDQHKNISIILKADRAQIPLSELETVPVLVSLMKSLKPE